MWRLVCALGSALLMLGDAPPSARAGDPAADRDPARFDRVGEGFTSAEPDAGMSAGYRAFTVPSMPELCKVAWPDRLEFRSVPTPTAGGRVQYSQFTLQALDRDGRLIPRVPIFLYLDAGRPTVLNVESTAAISELEGLRAIRPGTFRLRAAAACGEPGRPAVSATVEVTVGPACPEDFGAQRRALGALVSALTEPRALAAFFAALPADFYCFDRLFGYRGSASPFSSEPQLRDLFPKLARAVPEDAYLEKLVALSVQAVADTEQTEALQSAVRALLAARTRAFVRALNQRDGDAEFNAWEFVFDGPPGHHEPLAPDLQQQVCKWSERSCTLSRDALPWVQHHDDVR